MIRRQEWIDFNPEKIYNVKLSDSESVRAFSLEMMRDDKSFSRYLLTKMGYREGIADTLSLAYPLI